MEHEGMPDYVNAGIIPFRELTFEEEIGAGSFGSVYKGSYLGTPVAIKKIAKAEDLQEELDIFVEREKAMTKFSHPHLVQFLGVAEYEGFVFLITEYVPGGDLRRYLKDPSLEIAWKLRVQVAADVARGMAFLHSKCIMHRDMKSKNLLVDHNWKVKLCDFGFARSFERAKKRPYTLCGTEDWMAPEIILGEDYDEKVDVFSYGIVLCEIITRRKVANDLQRSAEDAFSFNKEAFMQLVPSECPDDLTQLAMACCDFEPSNRPDFIGILHTLSDIEREMTQKGSRILPSGKVETPTTPKPAIRAPAVSASRTVETTPENTKQTLLGVRQKFSVFKQSAEMKREKLEEVHSVAQLTTLTFRNPDEFYAAIGTTFASHVFAGWVLIGYATDRELIYQGSGTTVEELVQQLKDNQVQYMLVRVPIEESVKRTPTTRDVFINWTGPNVGLVSKGKKKSHVGELKHLLKPFHAELTALSKSNFTLAAIIDKSDPLSGSHVIDEDA